MGLLDRLFGGSHAPEPHTPARGIVPGGPGWAVLDVETSGLSPARDRVIEIAVVHVDPAGRVQGEWTSRVNPQGPVGRSDIHGIYSADVAHAPLFAELVPQIVSLLAGRVVVAHNATFDTAFLAHEFGRAGWAWPSVPMLCTLEASHHYLPDLDRRRLVDCCWAAGIQLHQAHSALGDARATAELLSRYVNPLVRPGMRSRDQRLLEAAPAVVWPAGPGVLTPHATTIYSPATTRPAAARPARASARVRSLLERLDVASTCPAATSGEVVYLECVADALADGTLDAGEAATLNDVAAAHLLEPAVRDRLHTGLLGGLCDIALKDGKITPTERRELAAVAALLGIGEGSADTVLDERATARQHCLEAALRPLRENWTHGVPLRLGDRVAFSGDCGGRREQLERAARDAGLRVVPSVTAKTSLLITDTASSTRKVAAAATLGVRVARPEIGQVLITHVQPAPQRMQVPRAAAPAPRPVAAPSSGSPAQIRAWALEQGIEVSPRGRLPQTVLTAFAQAHPQ